MKKRFNGYNPDAVVVPAELDQVGYGSARDLLNIQEAERLIVGGDGWQFGKFHLSRVALTIPENTTQDEWNEVGRVIQQMQGAIQWWIGDLLVFAEWRWGETYQEMANKIGYEVKSLRTYKYVASRVDVSIRMDTLSYGHHALVAQMEPDEQGYWLNLAVGKGWSISQLRQAIKGTPPALPDEFALFLAENHRKFLHFARKLKKAGLGDKLQISQLVDVEIERLEEFKRSL